MNAPRGSARAVGAHRAGQPPAAVRGAFLTPSGDSPAMREVLAAAEDVAVAGATTVLILGESGTGKEILARHIHRCSPRAAFPWVAVNCAALPGELLEGELFGYERGAFTGARERHIGRLEQADQGTLLLDEISELPLPLQAKLLRVLQEREIDRIGGTRSIPVDVRVIATSNRSLKEMVARQEFRADLYYRLNVFPIQLPPLRERRQDIPALADELVHTLARALGRQAPALGPDAMRALGTYSYPGNIRELGNIIERALVRCREPILTLTHLDLPSAHPATTAPAVGVAASMSARGPSDEPLSADGAAFPAELPLHLPTLERLAITEALRVEGGNRTRAARRLGISLRTLRNKLHLYRAALGASANAASAAAGQALPGNDDRPVDGVRSPTLARPSQSSSPRRAA